MSRSVLELRHLRTMLTLQDTGSVSAAAQRLHLTQSALSHQLKALETHYNTQLFDRRRQPLCATQTGQRLLALAQLVLPAVEEAERELSRMVDGEAGCLRIAVECHTCFDWLMPTMDDFRAHWREVELDIVSGFHADPTSLLLTHRADLAVVSEYEPDPAVFYTPLFRYEIMALLANDHPLAEKPRLSAEDFRDQTLITYPVPDDMLDLVRQVLLPAGINPARRTSELTVAILQLVASRRGVAALPFWAVKSYVDRHYISARPIGEGGLFGELYAVVRQEDAHLPYMADFLHTMREVCASALAGITLLPLVE